MTNKGYYKTIETQKQRPSNNKEQTKNTLTMHETKTQREAFEESTSRILKRNSYLTLRYLPTREQNRAQREIINCNHLDLPKTANKIRTTLFQATLDQQEGINDEFL